jgi:TetR/AcrR family transcriptional repressor of nem operon
MTTIIYIVKAAERLEGHMRVSREQAAANRQRIVEAAARLFRECGFDGVGVDAIMKAAGLTHGGFYGHFDSKDDLAAEAVARALARETDELGGITDLDAFVQAYLSERHCANRGGGCALAALGADLAREGKGVRRTLTEHVGTRLKWLEKLFRGPQARRRKRAIATLSGLVGALTLARAVDDPALSKDILTAAREAFGR